MARVLAIVADLMLASRVTTSLRESGHQVEQTGRLPRELDGVDLIVADLDVAAPEELAAAGVPVVAFYRHTDSETKARADAAGLGVAVPRSRMVRELPELVNRELS